MPAPERFLYLLLPNNRVRVTGTHGDAALVAFFATLAAAVVWCAICSVPAGAGSTFSPAGDCFFCSAATGSKAVELWVTGVHSLAQMMQVLLQNELEAPASASRVCSSG